MLTANNIPKIQLRSSGGFLTSTGSGSVAGTLNLPYSGSANGGNGDNWFAGVTAPIAVNIQNKYITCYMWKRTA